MAARGTKKKCFSIFHSKNRRGVLMISDIVSAVFRRQTVLIKVLIAAAAITIVACKQNATPDAEAPHAAVAVAKTKLLTASFEPRAIRKIEVGDFHLTGGQAAPVHTHAAPALGYVSKGSIVYQVEGQPVQILKAGDAFYEPVGQQILHFDNASQSDEAVFTDFNFERTGEPFIVFAKPPVNLHVDRRTYPTVEVASGPEVSAIDVYAQTLEPGASLQHAAKPLPVMGYVADGSITLRTSSGPQSVVTGQSFDLPAGQGDVTLTNQSASAQAKIVLFEPNR
jgi:quercetin dioxygenase-like cupin family protein